MATARAVATLHAQVVPAAAACPAPTATAACPAPPAPALWQLGALMSRRGRHRRHLLRLWCLWRRLCLLCMLSVLSHRLASVLQQRRHGRCQGLAEGWSCLQSRQHLAHVLAESLRCQRHVICEEGRARGPLVVLSRQHLQCGQQMRQDEDMLRLADLLTTLQVRATQHD